MAYATYLDQRQFLELDVCIAKLSLDYGIL
jgi:hypothetical protein